VAVRVDGHLGDIPADMATPLAVVLAELIQNAIEHGFVEAEPESVVLVRGSAEYAPRIDLVFEHTPDHYGVAVRDNGVGLPEGFDIDKTRSLGLAIVRDLVRTQLAGTITMTSDHGTVARVQIPVRGLEPRGREAPHLEL
jgi:two-component sensor histidine kinase